MRALLWTVVLTGCVSRNNHELVKIQLDATRIALSTQEGQCREDLAAFDTRIRELEAQVVERDLQLAEEVALEAHLTAELREERDARAALIKAIPAPKPKAPPEPPVITASLAEVTEALAALEDAHAADTRAAERHRAVEERFAELVDGGWASIRQQGRASVVTLPAAKLFNEGQVILSPRGDATVDVLARGLVDLPGYSVVLRGHTDGTPYHSSEHASNWELGFSRAITVLRALQERDVRWSMAASSYANTQPIAPEDTPEGRKANARVEVWLWPLDPLGEPPEVAPAPTPSPDPG